MTPDLKTLIEAVAATISAHAEELTALDSAIGDADHGLNMKRGFDAVIADLPNIAAQPLPDALKAVGLALVMKIGGASGPLYGTLFMALGKELPPDPDQGDIARAFKNAIAAVKQRGKAEIGNKTMLDVLGPVADLLGNGDASPASVRAKAKACAEATVPMKAIRGRASFLGERSIGHMDPGARSSELMISAICDVVEGKP
jgi:dihydroxyacetone kinase-like protein